MRCLIVTGIFPPDIGGPATFTDAFSKWLGNRGHKSHVISLWNGNKVQFSIEKDLVPRSRRKFFRFLTVIRSVFRQIPKSDFLIATGLHEEVAFALRLRKKKSIARIVGDPVWERAKNSNRTFLNLRDFQKTRLDLKSNFQRRLLVWSLNQYTVITCPSRELCELVVEWGVSRPVRYIPNGIKIQETQQVLKKYDLIVVSRLVKWKNVDKVLEVGEELKLRMLIIGDGPEMEILKRKSQSISANTEFLGEIPQQKIRNFLQQSKLFVQVSSYEGLSFSLLQAMEAGVPCIISNIPGNLQVAQNGKEAIIVDLNNQTQLLESIQRVLVTPDLATNLVNGARKRISESFNEEIQFQKIVEVIINED